MTCGRRKSLWQLVTGGAIALALTACGGGGGGDSGAPATPPVVAGNPPSVTADARVLGNVGGTITLAATASDPDGDAINYSWRQDQGLAATDTSGFDTDTATFTAPDKVDTLVFTVTATAGGQSDSTVVRVVIVEDVATAVFVDGTFAGTSDGSIDSPWSALEDAVAASVAADDDSDFYIKALPGGDSYTLWSSIDGQEFLNGQSVYGGYDANWERDPVGNPSRIRSTGRGFVFTNFTTAVAVSGLALEVTGPDQDRNSYPMYGLAVEADGTFLAENNSIVVNGPDGSFDNKNVDVYGIYLVNLAGASVLDNVIETGDGTLARDVPAQTRRGEDGNDGGDANGAFDTNGAPGGSGAPGPNGGAGGEGGRGGSDAGASGVAGAAGNRSTGGLAGTAGPYSDGRGQNGGDGGRGTDGPRGDSGAGGIGRNIYSLGNSREAGRGDNGGDGWAGGGGGGGGGGGSSFSGFNGGGGGGGGEGGEGGAGGIGAQRGGASVGIVVRNIDNALVARNSITAGNGGLGGLGATGAPGGSGGTGGPGAPGNSSNSGAGGRGGDGGNGGQGGYGGGGAGGPSYGVLVGENIAPVVEENTIVAGRGGDGAPPRLSFEAAAAGGGGWSFGIIDADPNDGIAPVVSNNTITPGTGGASGHPDNPPGESGDVLLQ
ncbi:MAG: hypothetical protein V2I25_10910 [Woeseiaceae bacterium]|jgi:hypothetical protein|nr:hypothetical protein [Woeseiaceae bacterium]